MAATGVSGETGYTAFQSGKDQKGGWTELRGVAVDDRMDGGDWWGWAGKCQAMVSLGTFGQSEASLDVDLLHGESFGGRRCAIQSD